MFLKCENGIFFLKSKIYMEWHKIECEIIIVFFFFFSRVEVWGKNQSERFQMKIQTVDGPNLAPYP